MEVTKRKKIKMKPLCSKDSLQAKTFFRIRPQAQTPLYLLNCVIHVGYSLVILLSVCCPADILFLFTYCSVNNTVIVTTMHMIILNKLFLFRNSSQAISTMTPKDAVIVLILHPI